MIAPEPLTPTADNSPVLTESCTVDLPQNADPTRKQIHVLSTHVNMDNISNLGTVTKSRELPRTDINENNSKSTNVCHNIKIFSKSGQLPASMDYTSSASSSQSFSEIKEVDDVPEHQTMIVESQNIIEGDLVLEGQNLDHEEIVSTKIRAKKGRADPENWKRNEEKRLRMTGKAYNSARAGRRNARCIQPRNCPKLCQNDRGRKQCADLTEEDRQYMFNTLWAMPWEEKKVFINSLVDRRYVQERTANIEVDPNNYKKKYSYFYYLKKDGARIPVCKNMFLGTLCLGERTVYKWIDVIAAHATQPRPKRARKGPVDRDSATCRNVVLFLESLPKLPSHYCRASSTKLYLEPLFTTFMSLYNLYAQTCRSNNEPIMNRTSFKYVFDDMNISLFRPRKDQCDLCCAHEIGNIGDDEYNRHIERKNIARDEKAPDKASALKDESLAVITMDVQAVLLSPMLQASALYYKTKLAVHNFTVYDLASKNCTCYVWREGEGDLSANTFSSCLVDYIKHLGKHVKTLIIYSNGCCYQNRNCTLSNALYKLSVEDNMTIFQKYLEKGHTQMEADSVHATIERKLHKKPIYWPQQYVDYIKSARSIPCPYEVKYVSHEFFKDYSKLKYYTSIRPGTKTGDPVVTDLRMLKYNPGKDGRIEYKLGFNDDFQELPRRAFVQIPSGEVLENAHSSALKIKTSKFEHLQDLKSVIPKDYHSFYDNLLH